MIIPETDPKILALAKEASQQLKALPPNAPDSEKKICQDYLTKANEIKLGKFK